ncbi:uncharacterized protein BDZ83DRAFT_656168 [Colletotrichum acutatum]|uniref:Uncharacterized protein n=1 Tax=Glomerella acutata TaxID=27357 RepID=A0AAD8XCQ9_GLOAC|nr:uncharacterized protein BDZ83DRAFT_656168 [Colletotrichum acutatum]KAK1713790.1 hypothetical protein BDZ83DRAFT_656168 [Colletotrichum acutatum]
MAACRATNVHVSIALFSLTKASFSSDQDFPFCISELVTCSTLYDSNGSRPAAPNLGIVYDGTLDIRFRAKEYPDADTPRAVKKRDRSQPAVLWGLPETQDENKPGIPRINNATRERETFATNYLHHRDASKTPYNSSTDPSVETMKFRRR